MSFESPERRRQQQQQSNITQLPLDQNEENQLPPPVRQRLKELQVDRVQLLERQRELQTHLQSLPDPSTISTFDNTLRDNIQQQQQQQLHTTQQQLNQVQQELNAILMSARIQNTIPPTSFDEANLIGLFNHILEQEESKRPTSPMAIESPTHDTGYLAFTPVASATVQSPQPYQSQQQQQSSSPTREWDTIQQQREIAFQSESASQTLSVLLMYCVRFEMPLGRYITNALTCTHPASLKRFPFPPDFLTQDPQLEIRTQRGRRGFSVFGLYGNDSSSSSSSSSSGSDSEEEAQYYETLEYLLYSDPEQRQRPNIRDNWNRFQLLFNDQTDLQYIFNWSLSEPNANYDFVGQEDKILGVVPRVVRQFQEIFALELPHIVRIQITSTILPSYSSVSTPPSNNNDSTFVLLTMRVLFLDSLMASIFSGSNINTNTEWDINQPPPSLETRDLIQMRLQLQPGDNVFVQALALLMSFLITLGETSIGAPLQPLDSDYFQNYFVGVMERQYVASGASMSDFQNIEKLHAFEPSLQDKRMFEHIVATAHHYSETLDYFKAMRQQSETIPKQTRHSIFERVWNTLNYIIAVQDSRNVDIYTQFPSVFRFTEFMGPNIGNNTIHLFSSSPVAIRQHQERQRRVDQQRENARQEKQYQIALFSALQSNTLVPLSVAGGFSYFLEFPLSIVGRRFNFTYFVTKWLSTLRNTTTTTTNDTLPSVLTLACRSQHSAQEQRKDKLVDVITASSNPDWIQFSITPSRNHSDILDDSGGVNFSFSLLEEIYGYRLNILVNWFDARESATLEGHSLHSPRHISIEMQFINRFDTPSGGSGGATTAATTSTKSRSILQVENTIYNNTVYSVDRIRQQQHQHHHTTLQDINIPGISNIRYLSRENINTHRLVYPITLLMHPNRFSTRDTVVQSPFGNTIPQTGPPTDVSGISKIESTLLPGFELIRGFSTPTQSNIELRYEVGMDDRLFSKHVNEDNILWDQIYAIVHAYTAQLKLSDLSFSYSQNHWREMYDQNAMMENVLQEAQYQSQQVIASQLGGQKQYVYLDSDRGSLPLLNFNERDLFTHTTQLHYPYNLSPIVEVSCPGCLWDYDDWRGPSDLSTTIPHPFQTLDTLLESEW